MYMTVYLDIVAIEERKREEEVHESFSDETEALEKTHTSSCESVLEFSLGQPLF